MRLPFVPRGTYDAVLASLEKAEAREAKWVERHDDLLARYDAANAPPEPVTLPERTRDEVIEAIMARAGNNGTVRAILGSYARRARLEKVPDDQIVQRILVWAEPNDDDPSAGVP